MKKLKLKIIIRAIILLTIIGLTSIQLASLILESPSVLRDFTSDGNYWSVGNQLYTTNQSMNISHTIIDPNYVQFNTTGFNVTAPNDINISLVFINSSITGADYGDKVLEFWANTSAGNVWFNLSGFESNIDYTVNKSGATLSTPTSNATGIIHFNNSVWSEVLFEIYKASYNWQSIPSLQFNFSFSNSSVAWSTIPSMQWNFSFSNVSLRWNNIPPLQHNFSISASGDWTNIPNLQWNFSFSNSSEWLSIPSLQFNFSFSNASAIWRDIPSLQWNISFCNSSLPLVPSDPQAVPPYIPPEETKYYFAVWELKEQRQIVLVMSGPKVKYVTGFNVIIIGCIK